jgi:hypothetical protein
MTLSLKSIPKLIAFVFLLSIARLQECFSPKQFPLTIQDPDLTSRIYGMSYNYYTDDIVFTGTYWEGGTGGSPRSFVGFYCNGCGTGDVFHMVKWIKTLTLSDTSLKHYGYSASYESANDVIGMFISAEDTSGPSSIHILASLEPADGTLFGYKAINVDYRVQDLSFHSYLAQTSAQEFIFTFRDQSATTWIVKFSYDFSTVIWAKYQ